MNDSNKGERVRGLTLLVLFMVIIMSGFVFSIINIHGITDVGKNQIMSVLRREMPVSTMPSTFENYYNSLYSSQSWSLDVFSFTQRVLGKHETRNFEVLRSNSGELYLKGSEEDINVEMLRIITDECKLMYDETNKYGGHFLYVQVPYKNVGQASELSDYSFDITEKKESLLCNLIVEKGIPILDLRQYEECVEYYKTDHHWTTKAAFNASKIIVNEIERVYEINIEGQEYYGDIANYEVVTYDDCFLGSIGIKVGPYFAGRDDFTLYKPKFETDITFEHYINDECQFEYSGNFWEAFIDQGVLENKEYSNKYNANMRGAYVESIIKNHLAKNDYKMLLITHSYGRPMAQYMCLNYSELRFLDPQKGRYNDNLVEYIREYQPDFVVFMYNDIVNVGDGKWVN